MKPEGFRLNYRTMLALCRQYEVPVIVDSDAHDPSAVGILDEARQFLQEQDFPEKLILNVDIDRVKQFIAKGV